MTIFRNVFAVVVFFSMFGFVYAQTNTAPPLPTKNAPANQPVIIIDASKLINNTRTSPARDVSNNNQTTNTPPSNNVRIGSNGQYIDNSKTEQITTKGLICTTDSGKKTCN